MKRVFAVAAVLIIALAVWTVRHFRGFKHLPETSNQLSKVAAAATFEQWQQAVEKVKADRAESMRGGAANLYASGRTEGDVRASHHFPRQNLT